MQCSVTFYNPFKTSRLLTSSRASGSGTHRSPLFEDEEMHKRDERKITSQHQYD